MRTIWIILLLLLTRTTLAMPGTDTTQVNRFSEFCGTTLKSKIDSITKEYQQKGKLNDYTLFVDYVDNPSPNVIIKTVNNYRPGIDTTNQNFGDFKHKLNELNNSSTTYKVVYINIRAWNVVFTKTVFGDTVLDHVNYTNFLKPGNSNFTNQDDKSKEAVRTEIQNAFGLTPSSNLLFFVDCEFRFFKTGSSDSLNFAAPLKNYLSSNSYISFYPYHFNLNIPESVRDEYSRIYKICFEHLKEREKQHPNMYCATCYWLYYYYEGIQKGLEKYKVYDGILSIRDTDSMLAYFSLNFGSDAALYKALNLQQIIHVIKILAQETFYDNATNIMVNCINNCPENYRRQMLDSIAFGRLYDNSYNLQRAIFRRISGDNLGKYLTATTQIANAVFPNYNDELSAILDTSFIRLKPGGFFGSAIDNAIEDNTGKILLANLSSWQFVHKHPFEKVLVTITEEYTYRNFTWQRGEYKNVPALVAYALFNHESNQRLWQYLNTAIDVGMLFIGGGEIKYLFKAGVYINAFKNAATAKKLISGIMAMKGFVDLTVTDVMADVFRQSAAGRAWLEKYNRYTMWVDLGYLASAATKSMVKSLYKELKTESKNIVKVIEVTGQPNIYRATLTDDIGTVSFLDISEQEMQNCRKMTRDAEAKIEQETGFIDDSHMVGSVYDQAKIQMKNRVETLFNNKPNLLNDIDQKQFISAFENEGNKELLVYLNTLDDAGLEKTTQVWKSIGSNPATHQLRNDVEALKGFVTAPGKVVPTSLVSKIAQQGANKLKAWTRNRIFKYKTSAGITISGADAEAKLFEDIENAIGNRNVLETLEDGQGRLSIVLERPGQTNQLVTVHPTSTGEYKITTFTPAYNQNLNPNIPVPVSKNRLVPDYAGTQYMHSLNRGKTIKIKMTGKRTGSTGDFAKADAEMRKIDPSFVKPNGYTWHHLDDFDPTTGECTMQLVESTAHQGTGVVGMSHSGSVAQWKAYYVTSGNAPNNLFYQQ